MGSVKVPRGFLVTPSTDSSTSSAYVPFFVRVRNQDILWEDSFTHAEDDMVTRLTSFVPGTVDEIIGVNPNTRFRVLKNNWAMEIECDGLCTMNKKVSIAGKAGEESAFDFIDSTKRSIRATIDMPVVLLDNPFFTMQATVYGDNFTMAGCTISLHTPNKLRWTHNAWTYYGYAQIVVTIISSNFAFPDNFALGFTNCGVNLLVRGIVPQA